MPDEYFSQSPPLVRRNGPSLRAVMGTSLLAFIGGGLLVGWLVWDGRVTLDSELLDNGPAASAPRLAGLPAPGAAPTLAASEAAMVGGMDERIAALEQRLTRLDLQAAAAEGNTARAEGLLVAFATRRAIERGVPLGYLADQLRLRFGDAQPNAVDTVIEAARQAVTLDQLAAQLDALAPDLADTPANADGWATFKRELAGLFVIRHDDTPSPRSGERLDRARMLLRSGQFEAAAKEVERLPGAGTATAWLAAVRRHAEAERALDLIETTALLEPNRLKDARGEQVRQPSPATPSPAVAPSEDAAADAT